jgi:hypothetical protein
VSSFVIFLFLSTKLILSVLGIYICLSGFIFSFSSLSVKIIFLFKLFKFNLGTCFLFMKDLFSLITLPGLYIPDGIFDLNGLGFYTTLSSGVFNPKLCVYRCVLDPLYIIFSVLIKFKLFLLHKLSLYLLFLINSSCLFSD